ncbi:hypothetical protein [Winogradskya humida]|uniref:hypothetical protein n=1 Tax=Winogradskya humida TaxID=113566 RepID=UPI001943B938|nr:hypothetical protein [Actinoplanes humidus]
MRSRWWWVSGGVAAILVLCGGALVVQKWYTGMRGDQEAAEVAAWATEQATLGSWPEARKVLAAQSTALVAGDEAGWMAAVDPSQPALRGYYQRLYATMRALGVTGWSYFSDYDPLENFGTSEIQANVTVSYCLGVLDCPRTSPADDTLHLELATVTQKLMLDKRDGAYKIVESQQTGKTQPPWQNTELTFATGDRVVVAAPASERGRLPEVVAAADKAATEADKFARYTGVKPGKYHLYLAGDKEWGSWYGGEKETYAVGYAHATGTVGTDVVLEMSAMDNAGQLAQALRHEFGHVVTLNGADRTGELILDLNQWLKEGVADYIGLLPRNKVNYGRIAALRGKPVPKDIRVDQLTEGATSADAARLYGYGYLAVNCMATKYGEARTMNFVSAALRQHKTNDTAARQAFGVPFSKVNSTCLSYFRTIVG